MKPRLSRGFGLREDLRAIRRATAVLPKSGDDLQLVESGASAKIGLDATDRASKPFLGCASPARLISTRSADNVADMEVPLAEERDEVQKRRPATDGEDE